MKHAEMNQDQNNDDMRLITRSLNKIIGKFHIVYSNIDEEILKKAREYEQEFFYNNLISDPTSNLYIEDEEIRKTLDSGSSWMK